MPDSFDMTTRFPLRRAPQSQNHSFTEFTNSEKTRKREGEESNAEEMRYVTEREDRKCEGREEIFPRTLSFLCNSSVASHSCGENRGFTKKGDHITIQTKAFSLLGSK